MWQDAVANPTAKPAVAVADWAADLDWQALLQDALGKSAARYDLVRRMLDQVIQPDKDVDSCLSIPE